MKKIFSLLVPYSVFFVLCANSQNIGIGTGTPTEKLHVAGNIKGDTLKPTAIKLIPDAGMGKVLTSDAAGNASWKTSNGAGAGNVGFGVWGDCATNGNISEYHPFADATGGTNDFFGASVSISGSYAIVGAYEDNSNKGSASIFAYNGSSWELMQKLTDATGVAGDDFGWSVSISGNYAIVGAYRDDETAGADQGSASIYQYNGSNWAFIQKLTDATGAVGDNFGVSVSISGNYAIVGAWRDDGVAGADQGSVSIYNYNGSAWVLMQKLTDATGALNDNFGWSVSISGDYAIVGAYADDGGAGADQGSVSIYNYNGSSWVLMQKLTDATAAAGDNFGFSVAISGNYAIAGAPYDDGTAGVQQGSASIYMRTGGSWTLVKKLTDPAGAVNDNFGNSVSISGNYAVVGAYFNSGIEGANQGSAVIYLHVGQGWQRLQSMTDPGGAQLDRFGHSTAVDGDTRRFVIGALGYASSRGKVIFGKIN